MMDGTDENAVRRGIAEVESKTGPIAVLVNNAGYGFEGAIEEAPLDEVRRQFEVNVFGPVAVMKAALPFMRKRRAGHIVNITSMGGLAAFPGVGIYNGSKYALEGISEALAIIKAVEAEEPPLHLLLGHDALNFVGAKLGALQVEIMKWAPVSAGTNFDS